MYWGESMTLQEILDAIAERYPHSFPYENIIKKINNVQKELYRTLYKPTTATETDLVADSPFYITSFSLDRIIEVVVNGEEYPKADIRNSGYDAFWYEADTNAIGIYPTPTEDIVGGLTFFRYADPTELDADNVDAMPDFPESWHMLIVYRVCKDLAEISLDGNMANVFASSYNALELEYKRSKPVKPQKIQDVYGGFNW